MSKRIIKLIKLVSKFVALNLARISVIVLAKLCYFTMEISELSLLGLNHIGKMLSIKIIQENEPQYNPNIIESKFTDKELQSMAIKMPSELMTLQNISEYFNVSMRQARKIRDAKNTLLTISTAEGVRVA